MPNFGGHESAYDHGMEMKVQQQLITQYAKYSQLVNEKLSSRDDKCLNCGRDQRKNSEITVKLNINCFYFFFFFSPGATTPNGGLFYSPLVDFILLAYEVS